MKTAILVFPGTNRERDMAAAVRTVSGSDPMMVWHAETEIPQADLIILPGGFSYGDYLRSGAIAARSPIVADLLEKAKQGVRILGVCNGFQILTETGISARRSDAQCRPSFHLQGNPAACRAR